MNHLLGTSASSVQEIGRHDKGRHTTTARQLFACPLGGAILDTPGMREMGADYADTDHAFQDIAQLAARCKFRDCTHTCEPGCSVVAAVAAGTLSARRLDSCRRLKHESSYTGLNSRQIEAEKHTHMFQRSSGMQEARRAMRAYCQSKRDGRLR